MQQLMADSALSTDEKQQQQQHVHVHGNAFSVANCDRSSRRKSAKPKKVPLECDEDGEGEGEGDGDAEMETETNATAGAAETLLNGESNAAAVGCHCHQQEGEREGEGVSHACSQRDTDAARPRSASIGMRTDTDADADVDADASASINTACMALTRVGVDTQAVSRTSSNSNSSSITSRSRLSAPTNATAAAAAAAAATDRDRDRNLTTLVRIATLRLARESTPITNSRVQDAVIELESRYAAENRKILGDKIKKRLLRIGCTFDHSNNCWSPGAEIEAEAATAAAAAAVTDRPELESGQVDTRTEAQTTAGDKPILLPCEDRNGIDADKHSGRRSISISTCTSTSTSTTGVRRADADADAEADGDTVADTKVRVDVEALAGCPTAKSQSHSQPQQRQPESKPEAEVDRSSASPVAAASDIAADDPLLADVSIVLNELHANKAPVSVPLIRARLVSRGHRADPKAMSDRIRRRLLTLGYSYNSSSRTYAQGEAEDQLSAGSTSTSPAKASSSQQSANPQPNAVSAPRNDDAVQTLALNLVRKYTDCSVVVTTAGIREELRRALPSISKVAYDQAERDRLNQLVRTYLTNLGYVHDALTETWQPVASSPSNVAKSDSQTPPQELSSNDQLLAAANLAPMVEGIVRTWTDEHRLFTVQDVRRTLILAERRYKRCDHTKLTKRISRQLRQLGCRYDAAQEKWRLVVPGRFRLFRESADGDHLASISRLPKSTPPNSRTDANANDRKEGSPSSAEQSMSDSPEALLSESRLTPLIRAAIARLQAQSNAQTITSPDVIEQIVRIDDRYATLDRRVLRNRIGYRLQYKLGYRFDPDGDCWFREPHDGAPLPRRTKARLAQQLALDKQRRQSEVKSSISSSPNSQSNFTLAQTATDAKKHAVSEHGALDLSSSTWNRANDVDQSDQRSQPTDGSTNDCDQNKSSRRSYTFDEYEAAVREISHSFSDPSSTRRLTIREVANELAARGMRYHHSKVSDMLKRIGCRFNASLNVWTVDGSTDADGDQLVDADRSASGNDAGRAKKLATSSVQQASVVREIVLEMDDGHEIITKDKVAFALQRRGIEVGSGLLNELLHRAGFAYSEHKRRWVRCGDHDIPTKAYRNRHSLVLSPSSSVNVSATSPREDGQNDAPHKNSVSSLVKASTCTELPDKPMLTVNPSSIAQHANVFKNLPTQIQTTPRSLPTADSVDRSNKVVKKRSDHADSTDSPPSPKRARKDIVANGKASAVEAVIERVREEQTSSIRRKIARSTRAALPTFVEPVARSAIHAALSDEDLD